MTKEPWLVGDTPNRHHDSSSIQKSVLTKESFIHPINEPVPSWNHQHVYTNFSRRDEVDRQSTKLELVTRSRSSSPQLISWISKINETWRGHHDRSVTLMYSKSPHANKRWQKSINSFVTTPALFQDAENCKSRWQLLLALHSAKVLQWQRHLSKDHYARLGTPTRSALTCSRLRSSRRWSVCGPRIAATIRLDAEPYSDNRCLLWGDGTTCHHGLDQGNTKVYLWRHSEHFDRFVSDNVAQRLADYLPIFRTLDAARVSMKEDEFANLMEEIKQWNSQVINYGAYRTGTFVDRQL